MTRRDFERSGRQLVYLRRRGWSVDRKTSAAFRGKALRDPVRKTTGWSIDQAYQIQTSRDVRALKAAGAYSSKGLWWHVNFNPVDGVPLALATILLERWRRQMGSK